MRKGGHCDRAGGRAGLLQRAESEAGHTRTTRRRVGPPVCRAPPGVQIPSGPRGSAPAAIAARRPAATCPPMDRALVAPHALAMTVRGPASQLFAARLGVQPGEVSTTVLARE